MSEKMSNVDIDKSLREDYEAAFKALVLCQDLVQVKKRGSTS